MTSDEKLIEKVVVHSFIFSFEENKLARFPNLDEAAFRTDLMKKINRFIYATFQKNCYDYDFNSEEEYDQELSKFGITDDRSKKIAKNILNQMGVVKPYTFEAQIHDETGPKIIERRIFSFNIFAPAVQALINRCGLYKSPTIFPQIFAPILKSALIGTLINLHVKKDHNS